MLSRLVTQRKCTRVSGFSRAQVARRSARHTAILVRTWAWSGRVHGRSFLLRSHLFHPSTLPSENSSPCHRLPPDNWMDCKGGLVQLVEERERERAADGGRRRWAAWPHFRLVSITLEPLQHFFYILIKNVNRVSLHFAASIGTHH